MRRLILAVIIAVAGHRAYRLLTSGAATIDVKWHAVFVAGLYSARIGLKWVLRTRF